jgi:hypothetical protein
MASEQADRIHFRYELQIPEGRNCPAQASVALDCKHYVNRDEDKMNLKTRTSLVGSGFIVGAALAAWSATLFQNPVSAPVVISTSSMIVQISSFVAAGYIVGLFYYLAELSKGFRELRRFVYGWAFASEKTQAYFNSKKQELNWDKLSHFTLDKLGTVLSPFLLFILSGLAAVSAGLTASNGYELASLLLFAVGVVIMVVSFWFLHTASEGLSTATDIFEALKRKYAAQ